MIRSFAFATAIAFAASLFLAPTLSTNTQAAGSSGDKFKQMLKKCPAGKKLNAGGQCV